MTHEIRRFESYDAWAADEYEGRYVLFEDHLDIIARVREDERTYAKQTSTAIMAYDEGRRGGYAAALWDAINVLNTHRISGYFCSCGAEINSQAGHHALVIEALGGEQ